MTTRQRTALIKLFNKAAYVFRKPWSKRSVKERNVTVTGLCLFVSKRARTNAVYFLARRLINDAKPINPHLLYFYPVRSPSNTADNFPPDRLRSNLARRIARKLQKCAKQ